MKFEQWPIERLKEYSKKLRKHDHAVEAVAKAINTYGFKVPILARSSGLIIDGHLRYKAAQFAGLESVPVLIADDLTENEVKAFRISVNKVAELAEWDIALLEEELQLLNTEDVDLSAIGFSEVELDLLLGHTVNAEKDPDELPDHTPGVARQGDLWLLGEHKLYVGDATDPESYRFFDEQADIVWTDPPYNVDYSGNAGKIQNDKMSEEEFNEFLLSFFLCTFSAMRPGAPIYVAHADGKPGLSFRHSFASAGFYLSSCLIWRKNQATLGRSDYQYQHEPILYGWKPGSSHSWYGGRKRKSIVEFCKDGLFSRVNERTFQIDIGGESLLITGDNMEVSSILPTIISIDKPQKSKDHPTMKPVSLVEHFLINSSRKGDVVLDPFGGSGTTLIASEIRQRKARLIELSERFADTIICRWQDYSGGEARLSDGEKYSKVMAQRGGNAEEN